MSKQRSSRDDHDHDSLTARIAADRVGAGAALGGKTLPKTTSQMVQMRRERPVDPATAPETAHSIAAAGTAGSGQSLPHLETIQRSFGHHDVSGVQAHVGGDAAAAAGALGARAYASGNQVAFGSAPDLHLAAHEAAHVVQQRAGVYLKDGFGDTGDTFEQHADRVADAVVQGQSAEKLLDQMSPAGASSSATAVQRDDDEEISLNEMFLKMSGTPMELAAFPTATASQQWRIFKNASLPRRLELLGTDISSQRSVTLTKKLEPADAFDVIWGYTSARNWGGGFLHVFDTKYLQEIWSTAPPAWTPVLFEHLSPMQMIAVFQVLEPDMKRQVLWRTQHWTRNRTVKDALISVMADFEIKAALNDAEGSWLVQLYNECSYHVQARLAVTVTNQTFQDHVARLKEQNEGNTALIEGAESAQGDLKLDDTAGAPDPQKLGEDIQAMTQDLVNMPPAVWAAKPKPERRSWFRHQGVLTCVTYLPSEPDSKREMLESIQDKRKRGEVLRQYLHTTKDTYMVQGMSTEDLLDMVQNWNYQLTQVGEILGYLSFRELYPLAPFLPPVLLGRLWAKTDSPGPIFLACSGLPDETIHMALSTMSDSEFVAFYGGLSEGQKSHIDRVQNQTLLRQGEAGTLKPDAEG